MEKLISIIVPIYNVEKYIDRCINSIINQTYKNLEIILIDDGSPDDCGKICDEYAKKDKRIKVIHKKNGGVSSARNVGIDLAKGEYLSFIDSDDYVEVDFIEKLYNLCKMYNCEIAECGVREFVDKAITKEEQYIEIYIMQTKVIQNDNFEKNFVGSSRTLWNKLYKKQLFENIRLEEGKKYSEDRKIVYQVFYNTKKRLRTSEILYNYRSNPKSITHNMDESCYNDVYKTLNEMINFYKEKNEKRLYEYYIIDRLDTLIDACEFFKNDKEKFSKFKTLYNNHYKDLKKVKARKKQKIKHTVYRYFSFIFRFMKKIIKS